MKRAKSRKIFEKVLVKIEEPLEAKKKHCVFDWRLWRVYYKVKGIKELIVVYMRTDEVDIIKKEEEMVKKGYSRRDLGEYKELIRKNLRFEEGLNNSGESF